MHRGAESLQQACGRAIQSDAQEEPADTARIHMRQEIDRFFALFCAQKAEDEPLATTSDAAPECNEIRLVTAARRAAWSEPTCRLNRPERARELVEEQHEHAGEEREPERTSQSEKEFLGKSGRTGLPLCSDCGI